MGAGTVPENYIRPVARLNPDTVVIIDTVSLDRDPGTLEFGAPLSPEVAHLLDILPDLLAPGQ